jgi:hypothetical protein
MASLRQIRANRQNSILSRGPSEIGKLSSRLNALTHGMTALEVGFEDDIERFLALMAELEPELRPQGPLQLHEVKRIATAMLLIERCQNQEADWRYRQASRTEAGRELDLSVETEDLATALPRRPAQVARRLQQTVHGSAWLLARLRVHMERICGVNGGGPLRPLDEEQRGKALDVLGVAIELRQGQTLLDLPAGATSRGDSDLAAHQARVIHERIVLLERFKTEDLAEVDAIDQDASAMGRELKPDPTVCKIRRYKAAAQREIDKAKAELQRLQAVAAEEARKAAELAREAMLIARRIPEARLIVQPRPPKAVPAEASAAPAAPEMPTTTPAAECTATPEVETFAPLDLTVADSAPAPDPTFEAEVRRMLANEKPLRGRARRRQELANRAAHKDLRR